MDSSDYSKLLIIFYLHPAIGFQYFYLIVTILIEIYYPIVENLTGTTAPGYGGTESNCNEMMTRHSAVL